MNMTLADHHRRIKEGIKEIAAQCELPDPDLCALGEARLRLSRASTARTAYVREALIPKLQGAIDVSLRESVDELHRHFAEKRMRSSDHVAKWGSREIAADWNGYRQAAQHIWAMMNEQMNLEKRIFDRAP